MMKDRVAISNPITEGKNMPVAGVLFKPHKIDKQMNCSDM